MEIATLIFIISFFAIISVLVTSTIRYMCKKKDHVAKGSKYIGWTSQMLGRQYEGSSSTKIFADKQIHSPITGKLCYEFDTSWYQREVNETQEKWKETVPKHSTRIKNRNKRRGKKK